MTTPIRVLLIDDHAILRAGLAAVLELHQGVRVVGQASSGPEGIRLWRSCHPDVGLVDINMDGIDGVETVRRILAIAPGAKLVMLTSSESTLDAARSRAAGAVGFVTKHSSPGEIVNVICEAHAGGTRIERGIRNPVAPTGSKLLSDRELAVLRLMRQGCSNLEIAHALGIAERTVKCHVTAIFEKVDAHDRAGAVARGFDLGLLEVSRPPETRSRN